MVQHARRGGLGELALAVLGYLLHAALHCTAVRLHVTLLPCRLWSPHNMSAVSVLAAGCRLQEDDHHTYGTVQPAVMRIESPPTALSQVAC